ncbi:hypothetical protein AB4099_08940 [Bosea sp. 2KB_26]|uniref:hypothetical protein n=1 Tax=Bosea sp. 2KB_26 TaxID=3237475 RepID=UPI003F912EFB
MRSMMLALVALSLLGCSGSPQPRGVARDLTQGTAQCSKHKWGTSEMAECLDRATGSQSATASEAKAGSSG